PCQAVLCNQPPSPCFAADGTCNQGSCSYPFANGVPCSDGNDCTDTDTCNNGVCSGSPKTCATPPPPTCLSATTLPTYVSPGTCAGGNCSYQFNDSTCVASCSNGSCGACVPPVSGPCDNAPQCGCPAGQNCIIDGDDDSLCPGPGCGATSCIPAGNTPM